MKRVIWLKTARVSGHNIDGEEIVERITIKLEDGDNYNKTVKYLNLKGLKKKDPPVIEKVMENQDGKWVEIDPQPWIDKLNEALKIPVQSEKIDFKALSEKQAKELDQVKANYTSLEERLKSLENQDEPKKVGRPKVN